MQRLTFLRVAALLLSLGGWRWLGAAVSTTGCQHSSSWESCHQPVAPGRRFVRNQHCLFWKIYGEADEHWALKQDSGELWVLHGGFRKAVWMSKDDVLSPPVPIGIPTVGLAREEEQRQGFCLDPFFREKERDWHFLWHLTRRGKAKING